MKGENPPRTRLGVSEVAEQGLGVGRDVFKAALAGVGPEEIRRVGDVAGRLLRKPLSVVPAGLASTTPQNRLSTNKA